MDKHHHWFDGAMAAVAWGVAHFDAPALIQALTIGVLAIRLALSVREWFRGRK